MRCGEGEEPVDERLDGASVEQFRIEHDAQHRLDVAVALAAFEPPQGAAPDGPGAVLAGEYERGDAALVPAADVFAQARRLTQ